MSVHNVFFVAAVRKKEAQRNIKREIDKVLRLMYAYTLVPCTQQNGGVKLVVTNQSTNGLVYPMLHVMRCADHVQKEDYSAGKSGSEGDIPTSSRV